MTAKIVSRPRDLERALLGTPRVLWISLHEPDEREFNCIGYRRQLVGATYKDRDYLCCDEPATFHGMSIEGRIVAAHFGLSFNRSLGSPTLVIGILTPAIVADHLVIPQIGCWRIELDLLKSIDL